MTTTTLYPNAHTETVSVDGTVEHYVSAGAGLTWAEIMAGAGTGHDDTSNELYAPWFTSDTTGRTNLWTGMIRGIMSFSIPAGTLVTSAVLSIYGTYKADPQSWAPNITLCQVTPASPTDLVNADYADFSSTQYATPITYANWSITGYNDFTINAAGLAVIAAGGVVYFGVRNANYDIANSAPSTWLQNQSAGFGWYTAEKGTVYRPKLVITYTADVYPPRADYPYPPPPGGTPVRPIDPPPSGGDTGGSTSPGDVPVDPVRPIDPPSGGDTPGDGGTPGGNPYQTPYRRARGIWYRFLRPFPIKIREKQIDSTRRIE